MAIVFLILLLDMTFGFIFTFLLVEGLSQVSTRCAQILYSVQKPFENMNF